MIIIRRYQPIVKRIDDHFEIRAIGLKRYAYQRQILSRVIDTMILSIIEIQVSILVGCLVAHLHTRRI